MVVSILVSCKPPVQFYTDGASLNEKYIFGAYRTQMLDAFAPALPMAIGLALSPLPVLALLIILMTANAKHNSVWFLIGWILGIIAVGFVVSMIPSIVPESSEASDTSLWTRFVIGVLLLIGAWRQYQKRPRKGEEPKIPRLLTRLDNVGFKQSMITGFVLSGLNVKNVMFIAAGTSAILATQAGTTNIIGACLIFLGMGSTLVILPITLFHILGERAEQFLIEARHWLAHHVQIVLALLLLFISGILLYQSIPSLFLAN